MHLRASRGLLKGGLANALHGSQDGEICREAAEVWNQPPGMRQRREEVVDDVHVEANAGRLQSRFENVYRLVNPFTVHGRGHDHEPVDKGSDSDADSDPAREAMVCHLRWRGLKHRLTSVPLYYLRPPRWRCVGQRIQLPSACWRQTWGSSKACEPFSKRCRNLQLVDGRKGAEGCTYRRKKGFFFVQRDCTSDAGLPGRARRRAMEDRK